jgi:hypothetical protein
LRRTRDRHRMEEVPQNYGGSGRRPGSIMRSISPSTRICGQKD